MDEVLEGLERFEQQRANLRKYVGMPEEQGKGKAKANGALQSIQFLIPPPQPLPRASWVATPLSYPKQQQQSLQPPQPHLDQPLPPNSVQPPQPDPMQDVQSLPHVRVHQPTESPEPSQAALHTRHTQRLRAPGQNQSSQHGQSLEVPEPALMSRRSQRLKTSRQNQSSQRDQSPEAPESAPATEPSEPVLFSEQIQPDQLSQPSEPNAYPYPPPAPLPFPFPNTSIFKASTLPTPLPAWLDPDTDLTTTDNRQVVPDAWLNPAVAALTSSTKYESALKIHNNATLRHPLIDETRVQYRQRQAGLGRESRNDVYDKAYRLWADLQTGDEWLPAGDREDMRKWRSRWDDKGSEGQEKSSSSKDGSSSSKDKGSSSKD